MLVTEALISDIGVLQLDDTLEYALGFMESLQTHTLPVVNRDTRELVGQVHRQAIEQVSAGQRLSSPIADIELQQSIAIYNNQHLFHAVRLMLQHELSVLPVVDEQMKFQGIIRKQQVLETLGKMLNLTEYGSVITIELGKNDFTISEVVQLIETEGGKILGITVEAPDSKHHFYEVSIKLNLKDISRIAASLRRYGYSILTEAKSESNSIDLETRADEFLKYLDI